MSTALHGGPDASGAAPHDFSTNGNAAGPCPAVRDALREVDAAHYPDPHYTALRDRLAAFHGVKAERIVVAASVSEFIHRMSAAAMLQGGRKVWLPAHSYGDYERAAQAWGLHIAREPQPHADAALRWCCEPSSPLGQPQAGLPQLAAMEEGVCVLDLAYAPLRLQGAPSLAPAQLDRVWQMWTPNKAMGLTGLRAAYAIAPSAVDLGLLRRIESLAPSWPIGAHGVALLEAWTGDAAQRWLAGSLETLKDWKASQQALCTSLGWQTIPSDANFFCARTDRPYPALAAALRAHGIKLRDCASFGLAGHVRLGVLPPASQQALKEGWTRAAACAEH